MSGTGGNIRNERAERLKRALRDNLRRRKAHARAADDGEPDDAAADQAPRSSSPT